jgi:transposase
LSFFTTYVSSILEQLPAPMQITFNHLLIQPPGLGVLTATALVATIGNGSQFNCVRQLAAFLGLVPRQNSSGSKARLGCITKGGDNYLRS